MNFKQFLRLSYDHLFAVDNVDLSGSRMGDTTAVEVVYHGFCRYLISCDATDA